MLAVVGILCSC